MVSSFTRGQSVKQKLPIGFPSSLPLLEKQLVPIRTLSNWGNPTSFTVST